MVPEIARQDKTPEIGTNLSQRPLSSRLVIAGGNDWYST